MKSKIIFLYLLITLQVVFSGATESKKFIILNTRESGMFSIFNDVLSLLHCYEEGLFAGIQVDFQKKGMYYDKNYGPNWWGYYCEPIFHGTKEDEVILVDGLGIPGAISRTELRSYNRQKAYQLIKKYIHLKPTIAKKIDDFVANNFKDYFILGIHYRGTDKISEAPRVPYEAVLEAIEKQVTLLDFDYRIFIATDEIEFINFISSKFPEKIIYRKETTRSENRNPVHVKSQNPYKVGEDALIDSVLLSKTNLLMRTSSNLSLWSTYFNPDIPIINLSFRYEEKIQGEMQ